ncbi:MAG: hypothetical protein R3C12_08965 [Planctomycetaceae bacterium]|nr:hypothetical protein [Planctomycetaceae bacterium]
MSESLSPAGDEHLIDSRSLDEGKSQTEGRSFPCPRCGADVVFHIGSQQLQCPYCHYEQPLTIAEHAVIVERDYHEELQRLTQFRQQEQAEVSGVKEVQCEACNGNVVFEGTLTSTHCPYCGSPIQLDRIHELDIRIRPDAVLPFQIDQAGGRRALEAWVRSRWFAPNDFLKQGVQGRLTGVYLPYWTYDSLTANAYSGERGETYTVTVGTGKNRRTETRVRWYPASGQFQRFFDDVLVLGCEGMSPDLVRSLEPWPLARCLPFTREALAGYIARTYDVPLEQGFQQASQRIAQALEEDVRRRIGGDRQRIHRIQTVHSAITFKFVILPIWLMSYRYRERVYQVMINAATGKVGGERPWSVWKILLTVLASAMALFLVWGGLSMMR